MLLVELMLLLAVLLKLRFEQLMLLAEQLKLRSVQLKLLVEQCLLLVMLQMQMLLILLQN